MGSIRGKILSFHMLCLPGSRVNSRISKQPAHLGGGCHELMGFVLFFLFIFFIFYVPCFISPRTSFVIYVTLAWSIPQLIRLPTLFDFNLAFTPSWRILRFYFPKVRQSPQALPEALGMVVLSSSWKQRLTLDCFALRNSVHRRVNVAYFLSLR